MTAVVPNDKPPGQEDHDQQGPPANSHCRDRKGGVAIPSDGLLWLANGLRPARLAPTAGTCGAVSRDWVWSGVAACYLDSCSRLTRGLLLAGKTGEVRGRPYTVPTTPSLRDSCAFFNAPCLVRPSSTHDSLTKGYRRGDATVGIIVACR